jgi:hypothetical protein
MTWANIRIEKAPDDADGHEQFYIVQFDPSLQSQQPGHLKETKGPLREAVIRDFLKTFGQPDHEVDEMLRAARAERKPPAGK